jgi:galactonate dehydratase
VITDPSPWIDRCAWNKELCVHDYQPMDGYIDVPDLPGIGNQLSEYALQTAFTRP